MPLINRVTRLFKSDLHAVLDRIEEPDLLLKQAVREMEEDLLQDERRLKLLQHELGHHASRHADLGHALQQIDGELDICFTSGKDDLARALIKRKLMLGNQQKFSERKQQSLQVEIIELEKRITENRSRLASMQQKLEVLAAHEVSGGQHGYGGDNYSGLEAAVSNEDVEVAFLREKQKRAAA